jgi:2-oxoisovalerate dehydrogenase E1 component alpha subunit
VEPEPAFQVLDFAGVPAAGVEAHVAAFSDEKAVKCMETMVKLRNYDAILNDAQRQGSISFYMQAFLEEANHVGSASALSPQDIVYMQYREQGVLLYRGFTIDEMVNQCYGNSEDPGKGRQMPVHYGSPELNVHTISSPLATQIPQAAGAAYALKVRNVEDTVVICYFGEGAASEGDFHAALNFAATLECPVIFYCRNNRWAISTPSSEQFCGDGMFARGKGYGIPSIRCDGNDVIAVHAATAAARAFALEHSRPVLLEAMTYRGGNHSTSDDSSRYRPKNEIDGWAQHNDPMARLRGYLEGKGLWSEEQHAALNKEARAEVIGALKQATSKKFLPLSELFTDVYAEKLPHLIAQEAELTAHVARHRDEYAAALKKYESS